MRAGSMRWRLVGLLCCAGLIAGCSNGGSGQPDSGVQVLPDGGTGQPDAGSPDGGPGSIRATPFFLPNTVNGQTTNARGTSVAVDATGALHVAYLDFIDSVPMYRTCTGSCADATAFTGVDFPATGGTQFVSLALDASGHPRMWWDVPGGFVYASCDAGCTSAAGWTLTQLASVADASLGSARAFALDAQGHPRAIAASNSVPNVGTYLLACDAGCDSAANWTTTQISANALARPQLTFGADGRAHFAAFDPTRATAETEGLAYLECADAACSSLAGVNLPPLNNLTGDFSLRLGADGLPRIAVYTGALDTTGGLPASALAYLECTGTCTDPTHWFSFAPGVAVGDGGGQLSLALDGQGHPRIAVKTSQGIGYLWCDQSCETNDVPWNSGLIEDASQLPTATPPAGCGVVGWTFGDEDTAEGISLALDASGNPRLGYDARHLDLCSGHVETSIEWPRFASFSQP